MTSYPDGAYRVVLPYACYGVDVLDGVIHQGAPISRWAIGRSVEAFAAWVRGKGGEFQLVLTREELGRRIKAMMSDVEVDVEEARRIAEDGAAMLCQLAAKANPSKRPGAPVNRN